MPRAVGPRAKRRELAQRKERLPRGPDVAEGMAEVYKESAKLDGMPVFQTMTMGGEGTAPVDASSAPPTQQQPQAERPSVGSALGGALGGKFGLGRKKNQDPPAQAPPSSVGTASASGVLIEMTTEMNDFSSNAVDASLFEIPAGFKKVDSEFKKAAGK